MTTLLTFEKMFWEKMRVISKKALREFWQTHAEAEIPLDSWYRITLKAEWQTLVEVQQTFSSADLVGRYVIFNIGGNKYRLVTKIEFKKQLVFIIYILTHSEYTRMFK